MRVKGKLIKSPIIPTDSSSSMADNFNQNENGKQVQSISALPTTIGSRPDRKEPKVQLEV